MAFTGRGIRITIRWRTTTAFPLRAWGVVADIGNVGQANIANPPYTAIRGAPVTDYILSKYQAHSAEIAEAEAMVRRSQPNTEDVRGAALSLVALGGNEAYEHLEALDRPAYDVVTIRNRSWMTRPKMPKGTAAELMPSGEVRLSWVIDKIQGYHKYNTYYCLFCRELKALTGEAA